MGAAGFDWQLDPAVTGAHRSLEPAGALPHLAVRLDPDAPTNRWEAVLEVERLNVDATSFRVFRERADGDPERMAESMRSVVADRGKLQNPWTGSGGVLAGRLVAAGPMSSLAGVRDGALVVPLVSLITLPLRLADLGPVDLATPQVPARGRAVVTGRMPCAVVPDDLPIDVALTAFDVYPAAWHVRAATEPGDGVLVLGAGHAGLLAAAAATECAGPDGQVVVVDTSSTALGRVAGVAPGALAVRGDATDATALARGLAERGCRPADVTVVCTTAPGCEGTALLCTATDGTILYFSTATTFAAAALGTDALDTGVRLVVPNGCTPDRGAYTLELLERHPALLAAFRHS